MGNEEVKKDSYWVTMIILVLVVIGIVNTCSSGVDKEVEHSVVRYD